MTRRRRPLVAGLLTLSLSALGCTARSTAAAPSTPAVASAPAPAPGAAAAGQEAFLNACSACHGNDALGGLAPALVPMQLDAATLLLIVREGRGLMPPLDGKLITDEQVTAVAAFLRSLDQ
jgi:mono/diheme cytochrome c family protein